MGADDLVNAKPAWSRRALFTPRGLAASSGGLIGALLRDEAPAPIDDDQMRSHFCIARRAMACEFSTFIPPWYANAWAAGETALGIIDEMEDLLTVYRESSDLSYLNRMAAERPVRVDERLYLLLKRCAELTAQTEGAFDVSAGALVKAWGFLRGPQRVPSEQERLAALAHTGMRYVEFDDEEHTVRYGVKGLEINLGSIGKGYAMDRAVGRVREQYGIESLLMQGGMSSLLAIGSPTGDDSGWLVGIQDPEDPARRVATVRLRDRGMGTSGNANQHFTAGGRRYGHVLDPRCGEPVDELGSVSVFAPDAATADALSTALFVLGLDKIAEFCQNHPRIGALVVLKRRPGPSDGTRPRVLTFNLPREDVNTKPGDDPPSTRVLQMQSDSESL
jgi:thiamine biosynthesis lipoprotein